MNISKILLTIAAAVSFTGCAHNIVLTPDLAKVESSAQPIKKNVGYYISDESRNTPVTTPGGGGDKVTYQPYRDIESSFYKMLSNVFTNVTKLKSPQDSDAIAKNQVNYVVTPKIVTTSSSSSALTWPPTQFTVELTCDISDASGQHVATKTVTGSGHAEFSEFKSDFSLSGKLATLDAILKMQEALANAPELK